MKMVSPFWAAGTTPVFADWNDAVSVNGWARVPQLLGAAIVVQGLGAPAGGVLSMNQIMPEGVIVTVAVLESPPALVRMYLKVSGPVLPAGAS
jgi:hypothetical protein